VEKISIKAWALFKKGTDELDDTNEIYTIAYNATDIEADVEEYPGEYECRLVTITWEKT